MEDNQCREGVDTDQLNYVGYGTNWLNTIMIIISVLGIIINSIFTFNYGKQILETRKKNKKKTDKDKDVSAVEIILCIVAFVETFISICWLINNLVMNNTQRMLEHCLGCSIIAHFEIFFYLFDWMILSTSLYQVRIILLNPERILESTSRVIKYLIFSFIIALSSLIISIPLDIGGVSPLLTCFININILNSPSEIIFFWIFFTIPLFCIFFGLSQVFLIMRSNEYKLEKNNRIFFIEYSYFVITYIIFSLILIISYIINWILIKSKSEKTEGYKFFILFVTLISCSTPLIVGFIRSIRTGLLKRLFCGKKDTLLNKPEERPIANLEKRLLEQLIIKYFTAVSYALGKSKYTEKEEREGEENETNNVDNVFNAMEHEDYSITKEDILKDLDLSINEDIKILQETNVDIQITEYNPKVFKKLRELEGFNEDLLISMFPPKKGTDQLIQKKNETIYINSINKLLMLKQIKKEHLLFYQRNILPDLYNHFVKNKDSIICRVFGLYKIKIDQKNEVYMALMYNINESLDSDNSDLLEINNNVKQMKINEDELRASIGDNNQKIEGNNKIFKINLTKNDNDKLIEIIQRDIQYLKSKSIDKFRFLVFERNIEDKQKILLSSDENNENRTRLDLKSKAFNNIKKYIFYSNSPNVIYTICILDYFRNN